jgi:hypothetical protein
MLCALLNLNLHDGFSYVMDISKMFIFFPVIIKIVQFRTSKVKQFTIGENLCYVTDRNMH